MLSTIEIVLWVRVFANDRPHNGRLSLPKCDQFDYFRLLSRSISATSHTNTHTHYMLSQIILYTWLILYLVIDWDAARDFSTINWVIVAQWISWTWTYFYDRVSHLWRFRSDSLSTAALLVYVQLMRRRRSNWPTDSVRHWLIYCIY